MMFTTMTFVLGKVSCAITLASPSSLCKDLLISFLYVFVSFDSSFFGDLTFFFFFFSAGRNLSSLNLGGEISPALGDLRNLQSMSVFSSFFF